MVNDRRIKRGEIVKKNKESNKGLVALIVCGVLSIALAVACIFFPEEFFGLFIKWKSP